MMAETRKGVNVSNMKLVSSVIKELNHDPKVDYSWIAVEADDGTVTLRGTVGSFRQKREAAKAAERVHGVKSVDNELDVRLLIGGLRDDAELRADVMRALMADPLIPDTVDVRVDEGLVTLVGSTVFSYQRDEAETVAAGIDGVIDLEDEIVLTGPEPEAHDVAHAIEHAIARNAKHDAKGIKVETKGHTVTLRGRVASWAEHDDAVAAAWAAPGVLRVEDHLLVA